MELSHIAARLAKAGNLTKFAKDAGVSRATLYRIMGGWRNPTLKTMQSIERQFALQDRAAKRTDAGGGGA